MGIRIRTGLGLLGELGHAAGEGVNVEQIDVGDVHAHASLGRLEDQCGLLRVDQNLLLLLLLLLLVVLLLL
jgi:hypothetical protein